MRPRSFDRGNPPARMTYTCKTRFNEAAIFRPRKFTGVYGIAQEILLLQ